MATTLILGATGNLGGLTAERLYGAAPKDLRVASSRERGASRLRDRFPQAETVLCDWNDEDSVVAAMHGVSRVFVVTPDMVTDESVVTSNVVNAAKKVGSIELLVRLLGMPPGYTIEQADPAYVAARCGAGLHVVAKPLLDASGLPVAYVNAPAWIMFNLASFVATEVRPRRRIAMPASTDCPRMWVSEGDVAEVAARILLGDPTDHAGKEYVLTSPDRHDYAGLAAIFTEVLGETVTYADDDSALQAAMGPAFDQLMTYLSHETGSYAGVQHLDTMTELLGRPQETLHDYVTTHKELFS
ncbi:NmrA family NAD(P)-binding protein [Nocardioides sp. LS1]|uniref:NAD(P)H-binding protein n=1 Tax=Nocardioides sp. LS1 TaxID=1027620 RepID=UPI000F621F9C|nr:NmrA family NAD(P)-binding protein [Nocardioides sp. LS1]GCD88114.1 NAD(P)-dependent oxidoreductase [Nocardioides sp. LS1]